MTENRAKLFTKLLAVQKSLEPLEKSGKNTFQNYKYTTASDALLPVQEACNEHGLVIMADIIDSKIEPGRAECTVKLTVFDAETGESHSVTCPSYAEDMSHKDGRITGDKAIFKCITGGVKYAVRSMFLLPSEDDPERTPKAAVQLNPLMDLTTVELKRLGWGNEKGKMYLAEHFGGKTARSQLTEAELTQFFNQLKGMPTPVLQDTRA